jgi:O-acetylhomoserine (thiol)-lyase
MDIPDIAALAALAHRHGLPLLVDNTLATPYLVNPLDLGADAVIHSTTKFISGHGHAPGGVVVDGGHFDWSSGRFPDFKPFVDRKGDLALLDKIWREHHVNFGATQAPFHSYLTLIGLDTFVLRMERHIANAQVVASFLQERPEVAWVNYPGMPDHPFHDVGRRQFDGRGFGSLMTFGLKNMERSGMLIDTLDIVTHAANLGDCRTLIIHPWSTQYVAFEPEKKTELGIHQDLLRLSVGIEDVNDIMDDLDQALKRI